MIKKMICLLALACNLFTFSQALAAPVTYTFHPYDGSGQSWDINDLDHYKFYVWQVTNFVLPGDQQIVGASLSFSNIYDWTNESNDRLYIHLLDSSPSSFSLSTVKSKTGVDADLTSNTKYYDTKLLQGTDNQGGGDNFGTMGTLISPVWSDPVGGLPANNVIYDFAHLGGSVDSAGNIVPGSMSILGTLESYLRNGNNFAFGIDPDCHYYNDKVTFTITVDSVPTPPQEIPVPEPSTLLLLGGGLVGIGFWRRRNR